MGNNRVIPGEGFTIIEEALEFGDVSKIHFGAAQTLGALLKADRQHPIIRNFTGREVGSQIIRHLKEAVKS